MAGAIPSVSTTTKRESKGVVDKTGQSGAVAVDLSKGSLHVLHLTGNVTGFSFSNVDALTDEVVEVHFVQDATGSRTLAGVDSHVHHAGALTLSTGANKRDIVVYRRIGTEFYERSRALNI